MKRVMPAMLALSLFGASAGLSAEAPRNRGPETIRFKMGDLVLPFKHWGHQKTLEDRCVPCHPSKIGKIDDWNRDTAHGLCISCHEQMGKGPVACVQCHKGSYSKVDPPPATGRLE